MENVKENRGGRHKSAAPRVRKRSGNAIKPVVAGQLEFDENTRVEKLLTRLSRSQSYIVRMAVVRLLRDDDRGHVDWTVAPEAQQNEKD